MDIKKLQEKLEKEKAGLQKSLKTRGLVTDLGSDVDSYDSQEADEAEEMANNIGIRETLKERLAEVESALAKLATGGYGSCEDCKKGVETEVLELNPATKLCKGCKAK